MTYDILTGYNVWHWSEIFNWSKISVENGVTFYNLSNLGKYIGVSLNCRITYITKRAAACKFIEYREKVRSIR